MENAKNSIVVVRNEEGTHVLKLTGTEARVLVTVPAKIKGHDEIVKRVVEALRYPSAPMKEEQAEEVRLPIPPRI